MVIFYILGFMRVYPTIQTQSNSIHVENFINGAKKVWDAWTGPKIKVNNSQDSFSNCKKGPMWVNANNP